VLNYDGDAMNANSEITNFGSWMSSIQRGAALFAGLAGVLGGIAGTIDWPVVGTFFGAVEGALAGAVVGVINAAALTLLAGWTRSRWACRGLSGVVAGVAAAGGAQIYAGPVNVSRTVAVVLIATAAVVGAALGPLVAYGAEPVPASRLAGARLPRVGRILGWGAALGAAAGAVAGLIIGMHTYLPTSPVAAVEGAVFGVVSGGVLACLVAGVAVLPRIRARR
jgi:hypothetical protein